MTATAGFRTATRRTLLAGTAAAALYPVLPKDLSANATVGAWSPVYDWPCVGIHTHLGPNGKILSYADDERPLGGDPTLNRTHAYLVNIPPMGAPTTPFLAFPNDDANFFCAGHAFLPDGRLLIVGGQEGYYYEGISVSTIFDFRANTWDTPSNGAMRYRRWYPTATRLPSGDILVLAGQISRHEHARFHEIWSAGAEGWRVLTGAQKQIPLYPWAFLFDGKVFVVTRKPQSLWLDVAGGGRWSAGPARRYAPDRTAGSAVMYRPGKILIAGGGAADNPTDTVETINLNASNPAWQYSGAMRYGRKFVNGTVLPDGTVLLTGGGRSNVDPTLAVLEAEIWNPATGRTSLMARMQVGRLYHSFALLLPDGRVLVGGGGRAVNPKYDRKNVEIYYPPYLYRGPRPVITAAPTAVRYGQYFTAGVSNGTVVSVSLMGLGTVTHSVNSGQSFQHLPFSAVSGGVRIRAPMNANLAPPGYYMLFVLNARGVPSVAKMIRVSA